MQVPKKACQPKCQPSRITTLATGAEEGLSGTNKTRAEAITLAAGAEEGLAEPPRGKYMTMAAGAEEGITQPPRSGAMTLATGAVCAVKHTRFFMC